MNCDECIFRTYHGDGLICLNGHKPKFVQEYDCPEHDALSLVGRWEIDHCDDFKEAQDNGQDEALLCRCGSITFHALRDGSVECVDCQSIHVRKKKDWIYIG